MAVLMYTLIPKKETRSIFHYILSLPGIDLSEERHLIYLGVMNLLSISLEDEEEFQEALETWASVWKSAGIVIDTPERTFTELVVISFYIVAISSCNTYTMESLVMRFDSIIQLKIGLMNSADPMDALSLEVAAFSMVRLVGFARFETRIAYEPSPNLSIPYRGYFLHKEVAPFVQYLDYIMLKKIARCSDCIFDTYHGITISDIFNSMEYLQQIWEMILEECGFDVDWVYAENDRRKRQGVGESSTHDISVKPYTSNMLRVRRRQGY
ncbi:hypothetical protein F4774DRAFT_369669 [Daldinia eschscholtzii]|nr:hypothetical protein F4774DRAFT_369669 [Daldinia eschscholtzii]